MSQNPNINRLLNLRFKDLEVFLEEVAIVESSVRGSTDGTSDDPEGDSPRVKRAQIRRKIEDALGATAAGGVVAPDERGANSLFEGKGRQRHLTDRGKLAKEFSEQLLQGMRRFAQQASLEQGRWGGVRVAFRAVLWPQLVRKWMFDWSHRAPHVPIVLRGDRAQMLDDYLGAVDPDFSIQFEPPPPGPYVPVLLWSESLVLVANNTGLTGARRVRAECNIGDRYVHVDRGEMLNGQISRSFAGSPEITSPRVTFTIQADALQYLCATQGSAGYFSHWLVRQQLERANDQGSPLDLTILDGPPISRPVYLVYRKRFGNPLQADEPVFTVQGEPVSETEFEKLIASSREELPPDVSPEKLNDALTRAMILDLYRRAQLIGPTMR